MAILNLTTAKAHLRIPSDTTDQDADIGRKVVQAEAIILDYLSTRSVAIASVSVASPTVITTTLPHALTSGATYTIGSTTTTPTINGSQVVTVTSATTFTVPVAVTIGQSAEAGSVGTVVYTEATVPKQIQAAMLLMLGHLHEHRGDGGYNDADEAVWTAIERLLMRSRDPALA